MTIKTLCVLQIGDIHYPEARKGPLPIDLKDKAFPPRLVEMIGMPPLQAVVREVQAQLKKRSVDALAFMGDLTHKGDLSGFLECIEFIKKSFVEYPSIKAAGVPTIVVPGNHDVLSTFKRGDPPDQKFAHLNHVLRSNDMDEVALDAAVAKAISTRGVKAKIYAINSCVGCCESRGIPEEVKSYVSEFIAKDAKLEPDALPRYQRVLDDAFERLDVPAVHVGAIDWLREDIVESDVQTAHVLVAHHNLIPQAIPRVSPYTEMLNGGDLRASLLDINRPLIYLHGHVHNDPIEIIKRPRDLGGMVVLVSAPLFEEGFNFIEIAYGDAGLPLGCSVYPFRMSMSGHVRSMQPINVPFWPHIANYGVLPEVARGALSMLMTSPTTYFGDLVRYFQQNKPCTWDEESLEQALKELRWLGFINIENINNPCEHWRIQRSV